MDARPAAAAETLFRSAVERYLLVGATLEAIGTCRLLGDQLLRRGRTEEAARPSTGADLPLWKACSDCPRALPVIGYPAPQLASYVKSLAAQGS